jgi:type II secretory pathway component GspD/PulD (secretin)
MAGNGFRSGLGRRVERLLRLDGGKWQPPSKWRRRAILILGPMLLVAASALSTAWARSPAENEGDEQMKSAWKRSVAATVLVVALGSADSPGGQQPEQPKSGGGTSLPEQPKLRRDEIRASAAKLADDLNAVAAQREELKKKIETKHDKDLDAIKAQLRELEAKQKDLEAARMKLEEQMKATSAAKTKLEKQPSRIKVYRLKHRDPNEVSSVLTDLLPQPQPAAGGGASMGMMMGGMQAGGGMVGGGAGGGMMGGPGVGGGPGGMGMPGMGALGMGGGAGLGGMAGGFAGGGLGGFGGFAGRATGALQGASWRIAVDERTNSLIVRGNESDLRTIGEIVAALDVGDGKAATKLKNLRTFKLKHADVSQVSQIVQDLELNVRVSVLPSSEMLVIAGGESALKEVADLIEELDVEGKPVKEIKKPGKQ